VLPGKVFHHIDQHQIGIAIFGAEPGDSAAEIIGAKGGRGIDPARQEPLAQRAERHETNAQFRAGRQDLRLGLAPPQRIFALQRGDGMDRMGPAHCVGARLGQAEMLDLTRRDQIPDRARHILDGYLGIDAVLVIKVKRIDLEPRQ
jgi:hypothetical protein